MSKLDNLIADLCPDGVEYVSFGDICSIITKQTGFDYTNHIKDSLIREKSTDCLPYIQTKFFAGKNFNFETDYYVPYYIVEKFPKITLDSRCILLSIVGASIGNIGLFPGDRKCFLGGAICVAKPHESYNVDYLFYYLTSRDGQKQIFNKVKGAGQATVTIEDIRKIKIPIPPLPVQSEIVRILDNFSELTAKLIGKLSTELTGRKKQYKYYEYKTLFDNDYKRVKLQEVCVVNQGFQIPISKRFKEPDANRYLYITVQFLKNKEDNQYYIENPDRNVICEKDDILVTRTGSTGVIITGVEGCFHNNFFKVNCNELVNKRYMYFLLKSSYMYQKMLTAASGGTVPDLPHKKFYNIDMPLPTLTKQENTADVLEKLDALYNDISTGLPAEIEARTKQYQYYRDRLLTFKECKK